MTPSQSPSDARRLPLFAVVGFGAFLLILAGVLTGATQSLDQSVLAALRDGSGAGVAPNWLWVAARDLTAFGDSAVLTLLTILFAIWLFLARRRAECLTLAVGMTGATLISNGLKGWIDRARPEEVWRLVEAHTPSFPSGHSLLSAAFFLMLGGILARGQTTHAARSFVIAAMFAIVFMVGLSRIYLGVHWTTDVLGGWALGGAWAALCLLALSRFARA